MPAGHPKVRAFYAITATAAQKAGNRARAGKMRDCIAVSEQS
jgi:hypothetical protein